METPTRPASRKAKMAGFSSPPNLARFVQKELSVRTEGAVHDDQSVQHIASALRVYGERRPKAADSIRGIRDWWLKDFTPRPTVEQVAEALEILVREGSFTRQTLDDGNHVWRPASNQL